MNRTTRLATMLGLVLLPSVCSAATYTVTDLGTLGGTFSSYGLFSEGFAINNQGQATGDSPAPNSGFHAFLYSGGVMNDLGFMGGGISHGQAINDSGKVVGYGYAADNNSTHAFLNTGGPLQDIGTLGGTDSHAFGINNNNQIVGDSQLTGNSISHAFSYSNGVMTDLGSLGGASKSSFATAINDAGKVVGYSFYNVPNGGTHAFLYDGTMHDLGTLGGTESQAYAINSNGDIVGVADKMVGVTQDIAQPHAFMYSGGVMHDLGTLGGYKSTAYGVNAGGQVVGLSMRADNSSAPFLYSNGTMVDLNSLIDPLSGWALQTAFGINDHGQIVGQGLLDGEYHAVILTPVPEPTSILLLVVGLFSVFGFWRQKIFK